MIKETGNGKSNAFAQELGKYTLKYILAYTAFVFHHWSEYH